MHYSDFTTSTSDGRPCAWALAYATVDVPLERSLPAIMRSHQGATVFGCTSFQGVFTPSGFTRGIHALAVTKADQVRAIPMLRASSGAVRSRIDACAATREIQATSTEPISCILMHATPGCEESILEGIETAFSGNPPPVYGGSAADDEMKGDWRIFLDTTIASEGFLLVGSYVKSARVRFIREWFYANEDDGQGDLG